MARNSVIALETSASLTNRLWAATEIARSDGIEEIISTLWNPWECPVEFLPYLAWALSVDVYENDWSENRKRTAIAAAPGIHRIKGARAAVENSLDAAGFVSRISEWWEQEPIGRRGTAEITVLVPTDDPDQAGFFSEFRAPIAARAIKTSKPKSRVATMKVGIVSKADVHTGIATKRGRNVRLNGPYLIDQLIPTLGYVAAQASSVRRVRLNGPQVGDDTAITPAFMAFVSRGLRNVRINDKAA